MAENLCSLRKKGGGGKYREYILWQNPSPSSTFDGQTITLSDDIDNYDIIGIYYNYAYNQTIVNDPMVVQMPVDKFKTCVEGNSTKHNTFSFGGIVSSNNSSWTRVMYYVTDTSVKFGRCYQLNAANSTAENSIPLQIVGIKMGTVKQFNNVKDYIRDKAFNGGFTEITTLTPYSSRVTTNEGKIVADTLNHVVYVYVDFTTNSAFGSSSDWSSLYTLTSGILSYLPVYTANSRQNNIPLFTDESSADKTKQAFFGYGTSSYTYRIAFAYGTTVSAGERYILYTMYTYR